MSTSSFYRLLKLNSIIRNHRIKLLGILALDLLGKRYFGVRLDPIYACNLRCKTCPLYTDRPRARRFSEEELRRIAHLFFGRTLQLYIGCVAEPTLYPNYAEIVRMGKEAGVPFVGLVTNGQLVKPADIEKLITYDLDELTVSTHGVHKKTYEHFMEGASYSRHHEFLSALHDLKKRRNAPKPQLRINLTINADNLEEAFEFYDHYNEYGLAILQIRPIMAYSSAGYKTDLTGVILRYNALVDHLRAESHARGVRLLSNKMDPTHRRPGFGALLIQYAARHINPYKVWQEDFDWKNEDYDTYVKRSGFRKKLLKDVFTPSSRLASRLNSLEYDVD